MSMLEHHLKEAANSVKAGTEACKRVVEELTTGEKSGRELTEWLTNQWVTIQGAQCSPVREGLRDRFCSAYKKRAKNGGRYSPKKRGIKGTVFKSVVKIRWAQTYTSDPQQVVRVVVPAVESTHESRKRKHESTVEHATPKRKFVNKDYSMRCLILNARE